MAAGVKSYRSSEGDVVDRVVWGHYGRQDGRLVERVLEANPGLADYGPILPAGVLITLPAEPGPSQAETVRLWG
ncbi:tail protein X [Limimaricola variabilis]|uniref:tail protein X n=1 Tax=Limimaricola variabilis TaxID=1492771 RepID=UPI002AC8B7A2|nr:tail protein X [Limimaricola variabilis]WPY95588.1 tail protein X [Limimaricola variabilis]